MVTRKDKPMTGQLPVLAQALISQEESFARFRRGLRQADQAVLDDLFASAQAHLGAVAQATQALPFEAFLLAMLLEEHRQVLRLRAMLEDLYRDPGN
jgi:hypothetical protein